MIGVMQLRSDRRTCFVDQVLRHADFKRPIAASALWREFVGRRSDDKPVCDRQTACCVKYDSGNTAVHDDVGQELCLQVPFKKALFQT